MLIVNADDLGASATVTDPVIAAYDDGLISSASAMVWMSDSNRAAELALTRGIPVGLHLNLTMPFRDAGAPPAARQIQEHLGGAFGKESWLRDEHKRRRHIDSRVHEAVRLQLDAFRGLYGEPTHIDGHHHVHVHSAVLACLPPELPIRPVMRAPSRLGARRDARERLLHKRFRAADGCVSFRDVHTALGGSSVEALRFAADRTLDVVVHAQFEDERLALRTREWARFLNAAVVGSYRDLPV